MTKDAGDTRAHMHARVHMLACVLRAHARPCVYVCVLVCVCVVFVFPVCLLWHRGVSGLAPARIRIPGERGIVLESWDSKRF